MIYVTIVTTFFILQELSDIWMNYPPHLFQVTVLGISGVCPLIPV